MVMGTGHVNGTLGETEKCERFAGGVMVREAV